MTSPRACLYCARPICRECGAAITGQGKTGLCTSCANVRRFETQPPRLDAMIAGFRLATAEYFAWLPTERREEYIRLRRMLNAREARRIIEADMRRHPIMEAAE